jgi:hypothetical protein
LIATNIIRQAAAEGVELALSGSGVLKASGPRGAVLRWQPVICERKQEILAALLAANEPACGPADQETSSGASASEDAATQGPYRRWLIEIPGRPPFTTIVVPEATGEWMQKFYPTATRIEAVQERLKRRASEAEAIELDALVNYVLRDEVDAVRQ